MKERPIKLTHHEVNAILNGHQTMLLRPIRRDGLNVISPWNFAHEVGQVGIYNNWLVRLEESHGRNKAAAGELVPRNLPCPYGQVGDRLWGKETYTGMWLGAAMRGCLGPAVYKATDYQYGIDSKLPWTSAMHMPKHESRITLDVLSISVCRVFFSTEADARAAGYKATALSALYKLRDDWEEMRGEGSWEKDWAWAARVSVIPTYRTNQFSHISRQWHRDNAAKEKPDAGE